MLSRFVLATPTLYHSEADLHEPHSGCWLASLVRDETARPEQILDSVIGRRQVLGIGGASSTEAPRVGDRVCFVIAGTGAVGHAELDAEISDTTPPIRGARRFSTVFRLRHVVLYDMPVAIDGNDVVRRALDQTPPATTGTYLSPLPRADYDWLTSGGEGALRIVG